MAVCVRGGPIVLLVPQDERDLAATSFADEVLTFVPQTPDSLVTVSESIQPRLAGILGKLKINAAQIGIESGESSQAASYLALHLYGDDLRKIIGQLLPAAKLVPADIELQKLKATKTAAEIAKIGQACAIAENAYGIAAQGLHSGMTELAAAQLLRARLNSPGPFRDNIQRCDGFAFCMSGPNAAQASAAFARTRSRVLEPDDLVMMHCNSYVDGFWTDITRTYTLRPASEKQGRMYAAVHEARDAVFNMIKPGMRAAELDLAARRVIEKFGLGACLRHGTGHGVGYSPMSAYSRPRIHAESPDVLEEGMVFNVEPAVYLGGYGGVRQCNMVTVSRVGFELLTPFQMDYSREVGKPGAAFESKAAH